MAEQVLGFRIEVKGTDQQTQQLSKLGSEIDQLKARMKLLNDIQRQGTPLTARQTKEKALLTTQLKATRSQYNALNKEILINNGVIKKSSGLFGGMRSAIMSSATAMLGWTAIIGGTIALVKNMVGIIVDFDKASSNLEAVLGATGDEMQELRQQAKDLGSVTAFTASNVIELQTELAKLGFPTEDIINMTASTLDAAAALGSELGEQAALTGAVLKQYSLDSEETARVNDVLAKSASSSALSFQSLSTALPIVGATAASAGVSLERTTALLGTLADRGIDASTSATSLRNIFLTLAQRGMTYEEAMQKINTATDKNAASFELFGKRGATAGVILASTGATVEELEKKLLDADRAAKQMADTMLDNLAGDTTKFQSAWEGMVLSLEDGEGVFSKLGRTITQSATALLGFFTNINNGKGLMGGMKQLALDYGLALGVLDEEFKDVGQAMINNQPVTEELIKRLKEGKITAEQFEKATAKLASGVKILTAEEQESAKVFAKLDALKKKAQAEEEKALQEANRLAAEEEKAAEERKKAAEKRAEEQKKIAAKEAEDLEKARLEGIEKGREFLKKKQEEAFLSDRQLAKERLQQEFQDKIDAIIGNSTQEIELKKQIEEQKRLALAEQAAEWKIEDEEKAAEEALILEEKQEKSRQKELQRLRQHELFKQQVVSESLDTIGTLTELASQSELNRFDRDAQQQLDSFQGTEEEKKALQDKLTKEREQIERKAFERRKKLQLAEIGVNLAKELSSIKANAAGNPANAFTFGAAGVTQATVLSALAIAAAAANAAMVAGQKYEDGGFVEGASHSQGGIQMYHKSGQHLGEMEGNEYIISAKRVREIGKNNLDAINFGGVNPSVSGYFANGGQVPNVSGISSTTSQIQNNFSMEDLSNLISAKMQETVLRTKVVNNAVDTFQTAQNVKNTESSLKFG